MKNIAPVGAIAVLALVLIGSHAEARMSEAQIAQAVEKAYPVEVLPKYTKLREFDGKQAYEVTVMNLGGNYNSAFRVTRLIVDAETGELLSVFRHKDSGYVLSGADQQVPNRQPADAARGVIWR